MTPSEFVLVNEHIFIDSYVDSNPSKSYLINDWDLEDMYERTISQNMDLVIDYMGDCYVEYIRRVLEKSKK